MKRVMSTTLLVLLAAAMLASCAAPTPTIAPVSSEAPAVETPDIVETTPPSEEPVGGKDCGY